MSAHPCLRAAKAVDGHSFPCAEQRRKNHECESRPAERQTRRRAAHRSLPRGDSIKAIEQQRGAKNYKRRNEPAPVRTVNAHELFSEALHLTAIRALGSAATCFARRAGFSGAGFR